MGNNDISNLGMQQGCSKQFYVTPVVTGLFCFLYFRGFEFAPHAKQSWTSTDQSHGFAHFMNFFSTHLGCTLVAGLAVATPFLFMLFGQLKRCSKPKLSC